MKKNNQELFPAMFLSGVRVFGNRPFIYERHEKMFVSSLGKEAAFRVNSMARALSAIGVKLDSRVAFCALPPSQAYWVIEWAALSLRATAVIIPARFTSAERISILAESLSTVAVVETAAEANELSQHVAALPELKHILCLAPKPHVPTQHVVRMEDITRPHIPVVYYHDFIESGKRQPDMTAQALSAMTPTDRAILFFYPGTEKNVHKGIRYNHAQLYDHARVIERLLGISHALQETDIILTSPSWNHPVGHIVSLFLPILKDASIQIHTGREDFHVFENHPHVLVADAAYIRALKEYIEAQVKKLGKLEWIMFRKALAYGKRKYEKEDKIGFFRGISDKFLENTIVKRVSKMLGGRLRLIIGVDDAANYESHLFFHTFGADLVEVPAEAFELTH